MKLGHHQRVWTLWFAVLIGCAPATVPPVPQEIPAAKSPPANHTAAPLAILAWNVESGGADPAVIARQLGELGRYDVYALSEVAPQDINTFAQACGPQFASIHTETGYDDRLQIIFDGKRFELVRQQEMDRYRDYSLNDGNHRSPLLAHLRDRQTGQEFQLVVNHLARGREEMRNAQAVGLREWARDQTLPTITVGDFNLDYDFRTRRGNQAFIEMLRDNVWKWVEPAELVDTNWSDPDGDGQDNYPDSMLDFAFVAGPALDWKPVCQVIVRAGDFPDDHTTSDHRPIELKLTP
jgi:endonuclease/exonuclease/phosphatase family metal-dependent hydrolase